MSKFDEKFLREIDASTLLLKFSNENARHTNYKRVCISTTIELYLFWKTIIIKKGAYKGLTNPLHLKF